MRSADALTLAEALGVVSDRLELWQGSSQTAVRMVSDLGLFARHARHRGVRSIDEVTADLCEEWVTSAVLRSAPLAKWGDPATKTQYRRRSALRLMYRELRFLGLVAEGVDPTIDLVLTDARTTKAVRPVTVEELLELQAASRRTTVETRIPAILAFTEATLRPAEIAGITLDAVDLGEGTVQTPGGSGRPRARKAVLSDWGRAEVERRLKALSAGQLVCIDSAEERLRPGSISTALDRLIREAGLARDRRVKPRSIIAARALATYEETGSIEAVANLLGARSLDRAAALIDLGWQR
ncbi:MAG: hypothetical protein R2733_12355 [Acidimicrobiales bacterium]